MQVLLLFEISGDVYINREERKNYRQAILYSAAVETAIFPV